jgi:hypothetical protein
MRRAHAQNRSHPSPVAGARCASSGRRSRAQIVPGSQVLRARAAPRSFSGRNATRDPPPGAASRLLLARPPFASLTRPSRSRARFEPVVARVAWTRVPAGSKSRA